MVPYHQAALVFRTIHRSPAKRASYGRKAHRNHNSEPAHRLQNGAPPVLRLKPQPLRRHAHAESSLALAHACPTHCLHDRTQQFLSFYQFLQSRTDQNVRLPLNKYIPVSLRSHVQLAAM